MCLKLITLVLCCAMFVTCLPQGMRETSSSRSGYVRKVQYSTSRGASSSGNANLIQARNEDDHLTSGDANDLETEIVNDDRSDIPLNTNNNKYFISWTCTPNYGAQPQGPIHVNDMSSDMITISGQSTCNPFYVPQQTLTTGEVPPTVNVPSIMPRFETPNYSSFPGYQSFVNQQQQLQYPSLYSSSHSQQLQMPYEHTAEVLPPWQPPPFHAPSYSLPQPTFVQPQPQMQPQPQPHLTQYHQYPTSVITQPQPQPQPQPQQLPSYQYTNTAANVQYPSPYSNYLGYSETQPQQYTFAAPQQAEPVVKTQRICGSCGKCIDVPVTPNPLVARISQSPCT